MDWWLWVLVGLVAFRLSGDVIACIVLVASVLGAASRPYEPDDLGG